MSVSYENPAAAETLPPHSSAPGRKINVWRSLRAHSTAAIAVFLLLATLGAVFAWKKGAPKYYAQAVILISPRFPKNLNDDKEFELQSNSQYREFVQQNVRTVNRYDIIEEAIKRLDASRRPYSESGESLAAAVNRLQGDLKVLPVPDTYQVSVGLEGETPAGLDEVVNTVVAVYLGKAKDEDFYGRDQRLSSLREEKQTLATEIAEKSQQKDHLAQELGVSTFSESFSNPFDRLLVDSKEALAAARQRRIAADAQLAALDDHTGGQNAALKAYARELTQKDADMTTLQANLNLRQSELLAKLNGMLPTHPGRAEIENELREIDRMLQTKREQLSQGYATMLLSQRKAELAAAAQSEAQLQKEVEAQAQQAAWYSGNYQDGLNRAYEMERARKRLESVEDRIGFIMLESQAPGFAHVFSPARKVTTPISGGRKKLFLLALVAGVFLALVTPVGMDMLDPHILSADEVEKLLGFAPIGYTYDPQRVSAAQATDRMRRLAAAIERDKIRNGSQSFLFLPVNSNAGLDDLLPQVAFELECLGQDVQIVYATGQTSPALVKAAVAGSAESVRPRACSTSGSSSFESHRAEVKSVRNGVVLVAVAPLIEDAEAEVLASSCDVVVLTVQARVTTKAYLREAARTLERIKPRAVSALVIRYDPDPPLAPSPFATLFSAKRAKAVSAAAYNGGRS